MRNLKKFLALVLAMMMVFSLMVTVNASNFADAADINPDYATAVDVLYQLGVLKGGNDGNYYPGDNLTRAQFAAILYRVHSGDAEEKYVAQYKSSATKFADVSDSDWFAGQVGYAYDKGLLVGGNDGNYWPDGPVTSTQVVIGMLRALGYDAKKELQGPDAGTQAVITGNGAGILDVVGPYNINDTPATRQMIAQLAFDTLTKGQIVNYRESTGGYYDGNGNILNSQTTAGPTLGKVKYDLRQITTDGTTDLNGQALAGKDKDIVDEAKKSDPFGRPTSTEVWTARNDTIVFTVGSANLVKTITSAMSEAEIFAAVGAAGIANGNKSNYYIVMDEIYQNGATKVAESEELSGANKGQWQAKSGSDGTITDTVIIAKNDNNNTIGFGNGVTAEVYATGTANHYKLVLINEYLGTVSAVTNGIITIDAAAGGPTITTGTIEADGFKVGDAVLYTLADGVVQSAAHPKTVSGAVTRIVRSDRMGGAPYDTYRVKGVDYKLSENNGIAAVKVDDEVEWYLDSHGYVIGDVTPAAVETVYHYGYLLGYQANETDSRTDDEFLLESGGTDKYTAVGEKFWFIDENGVEQKLDGAYTTNPSTGAVTAFVASALSGGGDSLSKTADGTFTEWTSWKAAAQGSPAVAGTKNIVFEYTLNDKGQIDLVTAVSVGTLSKITVATDDTVKVTKGTAAITAHDDDADTDATEDIFGTDDTIYFIIQYNAAGTKVADFTVVKGYGKVPNTESAGYVDATQPNAKWGWIKDKNDASTTVDESKNMKAMFLVVGSMGSPSDNSYVYFAGVDKAEIIKERLDDGTLVYTYTNVYVDGVKGQIKVKVIETGKPNSNQSALDAIASGEMYIVAIGDDGYSVVGSKVTFGTDVITAIQSGYCSINTATGNEGFYYNSSTAFYQVDPDAKTVTKVSGLPAVDATGTYKITLLLVDDGTAANDPATVVYFSRTKV